MKQSNYTAPQATAIKLHDLMSDGLITNISGVATEDSLAPRLNETDLNTTDLWDTTWE